MSIVSLASWLPHRPRRGATVTDTVVLHESTHPSVDSLIQALREAEQSYHYVIDLDGTVHKCVPYFATAYHAGNSYGPHEEARGVSRDQDARFHFVEVTCVNDYTISICLMRSDDQGSLWPEEQFHATRSLLMALKTPLPRLAHVTTHAIVSPGQFAPLEGINVARLAAEAGLSYWTGA